MYHVHYQTHKNLDIENDPLLKYKYMLRIKISHFKYKVRCTCTCICSGRYEYLDHTHMVMAICVNSYGRTVCVWSGHMSIILVWLLTGRTI